MLHKSIDRSYGHECVKQTEAWTSCVRLLFF